MIADIQALTDNAKNPAKVRENVLQVALDYLAAGLDPTKSTLFVQSQIPALSELTMYYMNLVSLSRLLRNPTVKTEMAQKNWSLETFGDQLGDAGAALISKLSKNEFKKREGVPVGFMVYPISQAADITAFDADLVPVGVDQLPMIEQTREIVRAFNQTYGQTLVEPDALVPEDQNAQRLPGIDGSGKMSKSLDNGIYLADDRDKLHQKITKMYTDPHHIHVDQPGKIEDNTVFTYLDVFAPDDPKVAEMKDHYQRGGLGDVVVKKYLFEVLDQLLTPIRDRRVELARDPAAIYDILKKGSEKANAVADETLRRVRGAIGVDYFL
jgi:tryptophanyl-tRNA synthetase